MSSTFVKGGQVSNESVGRFTMCRDKVRPLNNLQVMHDSMNLDMIQWAPITQYPASWRAPLVIWQPW